MRLSFNKIVSLKKVFSLSLTFLIILDLFLNFSVLQPQPVFAANKVPVVNAGEDQKIDFPEAVYLDGSVKDDGLPDPPGEITVRWEKISGPGRLYWHGIDRLSTAAYFEKPGEYLLRLTASDGEFEAYDEITVTAMQNQAPIVEAGRDQIVQNESSTTVLEGEVEDDGLPNPPGEVWTKWSKQSGVGEVIFRNESEVNTGVIFSETGEYVLRLTADDGEIEVYDEVTITVAAMQNQAPVVEAGRDQTVQNESNTTVLEGEVEDDGLPDPPGKVISRWSKQSGEGSVIFRNPSEVNTGVIFSDTGEYVLRLTVDDGEIKVYDEVTITVISSNQAPEIEAGRDQIVQNESNSTVLEGEVEDDGLPNPSGEVWTRWSKQSGVGEVIFRNESEVNTGVIFSETGEYVLRLTADDGETKVYDEVTITVISSNQAPEIEAGRDQIVQNESNSTVLEGEVEDDGLPNPPGEVWTRWSKQSGVGVVTFRNESEVNTGVIFSEAGEYVLRLTAGDGEFESYDEVAITVAEIQNQAPEVEAGRFQIVIFPNNTTWLDATVEDDGLPEQPGEITTNWSVVWSWGQGEVKFEDLGSIDTLVEISQPGFYRLQIEANDGDLFSSDSIGILVMRRMWYFW